ncbi:MAG: YbaK/EbsC family protein, partial [Candidatus Puniceispirillum sp.]
MARLCDPMSWPRRQLGTGVQSMDASSAFKDSLPTSPEAVMAVLENLDISFSTHHHPPLRTVEDSKQFRDGMDGAHIKNLYMRDRKKKNFLVVADEDRAIDMKTLNGQIGCDRLSFGSADRLFEMLGVRPG